MLEELLLTGCICASKNGKCYIKSPRVNPSHKVLMNAEIYSHCSQNELHEFWSLTAVIDMLLRFLLEVISIRRHDPIKDIACRKSSSKTYCILANVHLRTKKIEATPIDLAFHVGKML